ncbi:MAG: hypothetical protein AB7L28_18760, partial [Kofleriaceae bacterium]
MAKRTTTTRAKARAAKPMAKRGRSTGRAKNPANKPAAKRSGPNTSAAKRTAATKPGAKRAVATKPGPKRAAATKPGAKRAVATKPGPGAKRAAGTKAGAKPSAAMKRGASTSAAKSRTPNTGDKRASQGEAASAKRAGRVPTSAPRDDDAIPRPIAITGSGRVVEIIDDEHPVDALRRFLGGIDDPPTVQQGQIALGSAQLMLLPIAREHRGGSAVKELLDLVLSRWSTFPEPAGFHAQEFLRNAFAAVGDDRLRLTQLLALVPEDATPELRFNIACALAVVRDKPAMLHALRRALAAGVTSSQIRRDSDFAVYASDPDVQSLLDGAIAPSIPVDIGPHVIAVRFALDSLVATLKEFGETIKLNPPAALDTVLAVERGRRIQLPNDYRALLTLTDGMTMWDHDFFGTLDYRSD